MNEESEVDQILNNIPIQDEFPAWDDPIHNTLNATIVRSALTKELLIFSPGNGVLCVHYEDLAGDIAPYCS